MPELLRIEKGDSPLNFDLKSLDQQQLEAAAQHYDQHGFIVLRGLEDDVTPLFHPAVREAMGVPDSEYARVLSPDTPADMFPAEVRQRLARVQSQALARPLLRALEPILVRLIGPIVHVSTTFHAQVKGGPAKAVDHGGYADSSDYMEVHGPYLLHQDFAGATIPTSPSMLTLWVALNACPDWNLRVYPGSHRHGLLCNEWLNLDDPRLAPLGRPMDVQAEPGLAVIFNGLMLHGTSNRGALRRVSCDIRFFPLCGFLPSEAHLLGSDPAHALAQSLKDRSGVVLQSPLWEDQTFLGEETTLGDIPPLSVLNWVRYLSHVVKGDPDEGLPSLKRLVNEDFGVDKVQSYISKFHRKPLYPAAIQAVKERFALAAR